MSQLHTDLGLEIARARTAQRDPVVFTTDVERSGDAGRTPAGARLRRRAAASLLRWATALDGRVVPAVPLGREGC